jgi:hypothetical protein
MSSATTEAEVVVWIRTAGGPPEMHRRRGDGAVKLANAYDRMLWRDIEREFNFKAAMRGKAMLKKRAEKAR